MEADALNNVLRLKYDALNRLTEKRQWLAAGAAFMLNRRYYFPNAFLISSA
jgi:hypothetical protein